VRFPGLKELRVIVAFGAFCYLQLATYPHYSVQVQVTSHVLLAEDLDADAFLMRRAFSKAKIPTALHVVRDGEEVLAYLKGVGQYAELPLPGLLILDLKMPRMNGFEVLKWVRAHPTLKALPVMVLSASMEPQDVKLAYELGANGFVVKPTAFDRLVEIAAMLHAFWFEVNQLPDIWRPEPN
jgi:CheY-like chemotaxis protein